MTREDLALWKVHYTTLKAEWTQMTKTQSELESNLHVLQSKLQVRQLPCRNSTISHQARFFHLIKKKKKKAILVKHNYSVLLDLGAPLMCPR